MSKRPHPEPCFIDPREDQIVLRLRYDVPFSRKNLERLASIRDHNEFASVLAGMLGDMIQSDVGWAEFMDRADDRILRNPEGALRLARGRKVYEADMGGDTMVCMERPKPKVKITIKKRKRR